MTRRGIYSKTYRADDPRTTGLGLISKRSKKAILRIAELTELKQAQNWNGIVGMNGKT